jgi:hypothetical protein
VTDLSRLGKRRKEFGEAESPRGPSGRAHASPSVGILQSVISKYSFEPGALGTSEKA